MTDFKKLKVWQKSFDYSFKIYTITETFPKKEVFGLSDQMRRSALSIPSNIAEGSKRSTDKDFKHFLHTALGSCAENQTQVMLACKLKFISQEKYVSLYSEAEEINAMLLSFIKKLT